jgi:Bacterial Ig-like domain
MALPFMTSRRECLAAELSRVRSRAAAWLLFGAGAAASQACGGLSSGEIVIVDPASTSGGEGAETGGTNSGGSNAGGAAAGLSGSSSTLGTGGDGGDGGEAAVTEPPSVVSVTPADRVKDVERDATVEVRFSKNMAPQTVNAASLQLRQGSRPLPAAVSYDGRTAVLTPESPLGLLGEYTVNVSTAATDENGVALAADFSSSFRVREGSWGKLSPLFDATNGVTTTEVAVGGDENGNVLTVWTMPRSNANPRYGTFARWYRPGSGWEAPVELDGLAEEECYAVRLAVNAAGNAVAVWVQADPAGSSLGRLWLAEHANGAWRAARPTESAGGGYTEPNVVLSEADLVVLTYNVDFGGGSGSSLYADSGTLGGDDWEYSHYLGPGSASRAVAMEPDGSTVVVHTRYTGVEPSLAYFSRYSPSNELWTTPAPIPGSEYADVVRVALNDESEVMATWTQNAEPLDLLASRFTKAKGWSTPVVIDDGPGLAVAPGALVADGREFIAVWVQMVNQLNNLFTSRFTGAEGRWNPPALLSSGDIAATAPSLGVDAQGNGLLVWTAGSFPNRTTLELLRYDAVAQAWSRASNPVMSDVGMSDVGYTIGRITVAPDGTAALLAVEGSRYNSGFFAAYFE